MCKLSTCSSNLETRPYLLNPTFHRTSMDMAGQSRMGPWSHPSLSDVLPRRLADLEEEVGSDDNSDEESGTHADLSSV